MHYADIAEAFRPTGLLVRGGFACPAEDAVDCGPGRGAARAVVLVGNAGPAIWQAFEAGRREEPNPLDAWTRRVVDPIAAGLGALAVYPNDRPYRPFQRWAARAEPVHRSPLGLLIHPEYGLWHAYRAALLFTDPIAGMPEVVVGKSPCDQCADKPCLTACPVGAFTERGYDVEACATYVRSGREPHCMALGCQARAACPVGKTYRYDGAQLQFHMAAFLKARA